MSIIYLCSNIKEVVFILEYTGAYDDKIEYILNSKIIKNPDNYNTDYNIIGPKLNYTTPWCTNMLEIFKKCNIPNIIKIEQFILYNKTEPYSFDEMIETVYTSLPSSFDVNLDIDDIRQVNLNDLEEINNSLNLCMDKDDIEFYYNYFSSINKIPTDVELFDLSQSNSEHSRHWIFNGRLVIEGNYIDTTLFQLVKEPLKINKTNSLIAFSDNSSAIEGYNSLTLDPRYKDRESNYCFTPNKVNFTLTAETHNFPTGVAPFQGATTGIGGRIRDNIAIGKGGNIVAGTAGYCVGEIDYINKNRAFIIESEASDGASDYGNKIGEPIILGFTREFKQTINGILYEWKKPIMFSAGIGHVTERNLYKDKPSDNMLITRIGGPAYRIGVGGGASSSKCANSKIGKEDLSAVQRGDAEMENKVIRAIRALSTCNKSIIKSIHDQGAGGMANVTKEIVSPIGGKVFLDRVHIGDPTLSSLEIWGAEYQEQVTILIDKEDEEYVRKVCKRENVPVSFVGEVECTGNITVIDKNGNVAVDLNLNDTLENIPQKEFIFNTVKNECHPLNIPDKSFVEHIHHIFSSLAVSSKRFLTNKVDRSVTGLIAQQQCVGPLHTPLSNYGIIATNYTGLTGCVTSIGEQPIKAFVNSENMVRMTVGEMLTNMIFAKITKLSDIKCSGNWMWSPKLEGEGIELYKSVKALSKLLIKLEIAIDGGKDSMSMHMKSGDNIVKTPRTLVMSGYAPMDDIRIKVTPDFKGDNTDIIFIDLGKNNCRLGTSIIAQCNHQIGNNCPDFECIGYFKLIFKKIQDNIVNKKIVSGHDRSDGGLITTILEMCFAGNKGCYLNIQSKHNYLDYFFNEELGLIIETDPENTNDLIRLLIPYIPVYKIGNVINEDSVKIVYNEEDILNESMTTLRHSWEKNSYNFEKSKIPETLANDESLIYKDFKSINYVIPESILTNLYRKRKSTNIIPKRIKVGIIREEGSNGDKEMAAALIATGFEVWDINMQDLIKNPYMLYDFKGIIFVGGFSFSDVLGSASGWYNVIMNNPNIKTQLKKFYRRPDTFSLGVCNGCQLMVKLGIIEGIHKMKENKSGRFESRFSTVKIPSNNSIMLKNMENLELGIWVAHGEGRFEPCYNTNIINNFSRKADVFNKSSIVMQYVDNEGNSTEKYPYNPNGSVSGIAGVVSFNGRHLAMMPHPERCFLNWQFPWKSFDNDNKHLNSPWFLMFKNAYEWCCAQ
jgi:phosphoribosylformylglycinamidine synthase